MAGLYVGMRDRERAVFTYLAEAPQNLRATNRDIAEATGRSPSEVSRAVQVLQDCGKISSTVERGHLRRIELLA